MFFEISGSERVKWTLVKDVDFLDTSYLMRWHPGRHPHPHLNDTFSFVPSLTTTTTITNDNNNNNNQDLLGTKNSRPIRFVVLAPYGSDEQYSLDKIMPAIIAAVKSIEDETKINKYKYLDWEHGAEIYFVDTQCSSAIDPLAAFYYYIRSNEL